MAPRKWQAESTCSAFFGVAKLPLGLRAYGRDFTGPLLPWDWRVADYTQAEVNRVYAYLAERDRHIYNPGLANTAQTRESSRQLLEDTLGVPVRVAWNPTFRRAGAEVSEAGEAIGGHGWTWNPVKLTGNVCGRALDAAGTALSIAGVGLDVAVAGAEKIPLVRKLEPTYLHSMHLYNEALEHVMAHGDRGARVYGWMHSEGAIHGTIILASLSADELRSVVARTFGAGGYLFPRGTGVEHYGCRSTGFWGRDPVPQFAGMNAVRRRRDIRWVHTGRGGWPHGIGTYVEFVILDLAKDYFSSNARKILGR